MPDNGTWIMVTGATGGIGKALVGRLIADGNNVIAAARDPARLLRGRTWTVDLPSPRYGTG